MATYRRADALQDGDNIVLGNSVHKVHSAESDGLEVTLFTSIRGWGEEPDMWTTDYRTRFEIV